MKLKPIRSQNITGRISNICMHCNKEFKKIINTVKFCSEKCEIAYVNKKIGIK